MSCNKPPSLQEQADRDHADYLLMVEILKERDAARARWGEEFDDKNTVNDWIAYVSSYAARAFIWPFSPTVFRDSFIKVAVIAIAAVQALDRNGGKIAKRHYEDT